ncbi:substrate-binding domain-containing protein [Anaerosporobacter sp.]|uniref:substrate-binding domain-containing protein n=1 Tax=Anaerosporobacter sp. TaxID=1872529 RepID=UPI00286F5B98|nr:substrate-binding domain-containing protein [Anaerosporobacter sp.]
MKENESVGTRKSVIIASALCILFMLTCTIGGIVFFKMQINKSDVHRQMDSYKSYDKYYVMIPSDRKSPFWESVYEYASLAGDENDAFVEMFDMNLSEEYSAAQLMRMAIEADVDGIILEADETQELTTLIDEAVERGIPVVTAMRDNTQSERQSYVGISSHNLGREYGKQVCKLAKEYEKKDGYGVDSSLTVMVLIDANAEDTSQNMIYASIQETIEEVYKGGLKIQCSAKALNSHGAFAAEEAIRDIFMGEEKLPDVIICLNEINTTCVYQAVVDYYKVGAINIIGYYDSQRILKAIERNVVYATISVDAKALGEYCIEALTEYDQMGHVSNYYSVDTTVINSKNVSEYLGGDASEE